MENEQTPPAKTKEADEVSSQSSRAFYEDFSLIVYSGAKRLKAQYSNKENVLNVLLVRSG